MLSNSTRKLLWFEIGKMWLQLKKITVSFIIIFGTLSFPILSRNFVHTYTWGSPRRATTRHCGPPTAHWDL